MFGFGKPKNGQRKMLLDFLIHNADIIQKSEGKSRADAEYLAACMIIDDLAKRPNGREGHQQMMEILQSDYPQHFNDVITYLAWSSGKITLKPEYEAQLQARHAK